MLHLNESESISATGADTAEGAAHRLAEKTGNVVIITLGDRGVLLCEDGKTSVIPAERAEVVDTIGAGDSHIGAVMAMRALGHSFEEAVRTANKVSAMVVGVKGPTLTKEQFEKGL